jgi:hypothetical protein
LEVADPKFRPQLLGQPSLARILMNLDSTNRQSQTYLGKSLAANKGGAYRNGNAYDSKDVPLVYLQCPNYYLRKG